MAKKFISGGCSFTFGHELGDEQNGKVPSKKSWAYLLKDKYFPASDYICTAVPGSGNSAIARRILEAVSENPKDVDAVVVMWSFTSRYEWAFPRHKALEKNRWANISPWDTSDSENESYKILAQDSVQSQLFEERRQNFRDAGVTDMSDAIYKHGANQYHEVYLSWKSIIWIQNILEKYQIPFLFTLADNSLFYQMFTPHNEQDQLMRGMHEQIDFTKWHFFGERCMGFNQWATLNDYPRGITHPLDKAHKDAIMLIQATFEKIIGGQK